MNENENTATRYWVAWCESTEHGYAEAGPGDPGMAEHVELRNPADMPWGCRHYADYETAKEVAQHFRELIRDPGIMCLTNAERGQRLRDILKASGVSQRQYATSIGITRRMVEYLIAGAFPVRIHHLAEASVLAERALKLFGPDRCKRIRKPYDNISDIRNILLSTTANSCTLSTPNLTPAQRLRVLIDESGLCVADFAPLIGISKSTLFLMLHGKYQHEIPERLLRLAADASANCRKFLRPLRTKAK